jgi:uncharacterized protein
LKLDLSEIAFNLGKKHKLEFDIPPFFLEDGVKCVSNIVGKISFSNTGSVIIVRGFFKTSIELECSRCLNNFIMDLDIPIEEELLIAKEVAGDFSDSDSDNELPEEEQEPVFENNIFNLSEVIRQSIIASLPISTICKEDCKGICVNCGKNLNEDICNCQPEDVDSPFSALKALLEEKERKK